MNEVILGILIPFLGTSFGSAMVFFMKDKLNEKIEKILLGFAAGVMMAASVWSLIIPSINQSSLLNVAIWFPTSIGILFGFAFLLMLDSIIPHMHIVSKISEGKSTKLHKRTMMIFAVTLHNIPEGMAVGVVLAGAFFGKSLMSLSSALALSIGIAIQNFPEGAIISMPLSAEGLNKKKSFFIGAISGIVEPIAAIITFFITGVIVPILPYILAFAAGAMIYVVIEEIVPESQAGNHSNLATIGFFVGFVLMLILDVAL